MLPTLTIAIATMGDKVHQIRLPEPQCGIRYYVGIQRATGIPEILSVRDDVEIEVLDSIGLSRNRNAALQQCNTDLLLLADDDLVFHLDAINEMRAEFECDEALDIATGRLNDTEGRPFKAYPLHGLSMTRRNCGFIGSPEVMLRMSFVRREKLSFDERFGVGSDHPSGEEYIFVTDAMSVGASVRHFSYILAEHPPMSTGDNWHDPRIVDARARVLTRVWGSAAPLFRSVYAFRKRDRLGLMNTFRFALGMSIHSISCRKNG